MRDTNLLYELARSQHMTGENKQALETLERLLDLEPSHADALYLLGSVSMGRLAEASVFRKLGFAKRALKAWQNAAAAAPDSAEAHFAVFSYYVQAPGMAGGDIELAQAKVPEIEALSESYGHMARAELARSREQPESALSHYERAAEAADAPAAAWFSVARARSDQGDQQSARAALATFEALPHEWQDPDAAAVLWLEGRIFKGEGDVAAARKAWQQAMELEPAKDMLTALEKEIDEL